MTTKNIRLLVFAVLSLTVYLLVTRLDINRKERLLKQFHMQTEGAIHNFGFRGSNVKVLPQYSFFLGDKEYKGAIGESKICPSLSRQQKKRILQLRIPIIYWPDDPDINRMLVLESEYKEYNVPYPDSLKQILEQYFCD